VDKAMEQTDYIRHVFYEDNDGFMIIYNVLKDSLNKKNAFVKWYTDDAPTQTVSTYSNVTSEQLDILVREQDIEDVEVIENEPVGDQPPTFDVTVIKVTRQNITRVVSIPPEEFRID